MKAKCIICGYLDDLKENKKYGNEVNFIYDEPICRACEEDYSIFLDCGIKPSEIKKLVGDENESNGHRN
jgi:PP-loop superfamily ATP-utilizing enzyme